jgi:tetratricopeptide (TPR) repeat protein
MGRLHAQSNTYALIIGVSKYKNAGIKHLKYADKDALEFKKMLMAKAGGGVKKENIKCFVNDSATISNCQAAMKWMYNAPKSGDKVIFYFSGHGDAINSEFVYLLPYDVDASDPINYEGNAIGLKNLKGFYIKMLLAKGVQVTMITDACRTNEVTTTNSFGVTFGKAMLENNGELTFTSCQADQKSEEDERWGHGHGVFTWFLMQGWMGLADENENGDVTAGELFDYVKDKVKKETFDFEKKITRQVPATCCENFEDIVISQVDAETLRRLKEIEEGLKDTLDIIAYATKKSGGDTYDEDTATLRLYNQLIGSVADDQILYPANHCAYYYYNQLKTVADDKPIFYDAEAELLSALSAKGQEVLNNYLNGAYADINSGVFKDAYEYMNTGLQIIPQDDPYYVNFKTKALFLESQYLMYKVASRSQALAKIDSAIALQPNGAYLFYSKGLIYEKFLNYDSAIVNYNRALQLAPKWSAPYAQKSGILIATGRRTDAIGVMQDMMKKSNRALNYQVMGNFYLDIDSLHLAVNHYQQAVDKDTSLIDAYIGLFTCYRRLLNDSLSDYYYNKAYQLNPDYKKIVAMDANYDAIIGNYSKAATKYLSIYEADTTNLYYYVKTAEMQYRQGDQRQAMVSFNKILDMDPYYTHAYYTLIDLEDDQGNYENSLRYNKRLLAIDPGYNPAKLYMPFSQLGMKDSAVYYLNLASKKFPNDRFTLEYKAWDLMENKKYNDAIFLYERMVKKETVNGSIYTNLAYCYRQLNHKEKCLRYGMLAVKYNKYDITSYRNLVSHLWGFKCSADTIARFVLEPLEKFDIQTESYLEYAAYQLTYLTQHEKLANVCKLAIGLYPSNYKFYLYHAVYYRKTNKKDFYAYFQMAVDLGLRCDDIEEYKSILPDPKEDKKYHKISKKICSE